MKLTEGIHTGVPNDDYHADRTAISSSGIKLINSHSPWHLRSYLDSPPAKPVHTVSALTMGSAVDCLIFEPEEFKKQFTVHPNLNMRTNAAKEEWAVLIADWKKTKKQPLKQSAYEEAMMTAEAIRKNPRMVDILKDGVSQMVVVWRDPATGTLCKCKTDWYSKKNKLIVDLKTALDASPEGFSKAVHNYGYHIQHAFYFDGYLYAGLPVERFLFAVQEKPDGRNTFRADPRLMAWYELDEEDVEAGRDSYISALGAINYCNMMDEWEGYTNEIMPLSRPPWAKKTDVQAVTAL